MQKIIKTKGLESAEVCTSFGCKLYVTPDPVDGTEAYLSFREGHDGAQDWTWNATDIKELSEFLAEVAALMNKGDL